MWPGEAAPLRAALLVGLLAVLGPAPASAEPGGAQVAQESPARQLSDKEVRRLLIQQSIRRYPGSCPCPYNYDRGGRRCGGRSAYSRPGGRSPLCYEGDVTQEMVDRYRERQ